MWPGPMWEQVRSSLTRREHTSNMLRYDLSLSDADSKSRDVCASQDAMR